MTGASHQIWLTRHVLVENIFDEDTSHISRHAIIERYHDRAVFGAPDKECFERWFPEKWRPKFAAAGCVVLIYMIPDEYIYPGNSAAEVVFPLKKAADKRRCDPITLTPV